MGRNSHRTGGRRTDDCQLATETATRTATNASTNPLQLRQCLHLFYAGRSGYPEYPWEQFPSRTKMAGAGDSIQVVVNVLRDATRSRRSFTSSAIIANSIALDSVLKAVCTARVRYSSQ